MHIHAIVVLRFKFSSQRLSFGDDQPNYHIQDIRSLENKACNEKEDEELDKLKREVETIKKVSVYC